MLALLLYAYCEGERSSRRIERRCREDIAFRVLSANQQPDHATICRFRQRHEPALAGLFVEVLRLCAEAGLAPSGVVALDGTKLRANASRERNRTSAQLEAEVERMLAEAEQVDSGRERGDALPPELHSRSQRLARLREAQARLAASNRQRQDAYEVRLREREQKDARGRQPGRTLDPRADAAHADDQAWPSALRTASLDDRTGLRPDQGEPRHPPLPATRLRGLRQRMETDRRQPQPAQALSPPAAPTLARAGRSPLSEASPRSDQPGPTPNYPCPISTDTLNPTAPRRLSTTPTVAKLYATASVVESIGKVQYSHCSVAAPGACLRSLPPSADSQSPLHAGTRFGARPIWWWCFGRRGSGSPREAGTGSSDF